MRDISLILKEVYAADGVALVLGGGTFEMEAVAPQIAVDKLVMVGFLIAGLKSFRLDLSLIMKW